MDYHANIQWNSLFRCDNKTVIKDVSFCATNIVVLCESLDIESFVLIRVSRSRSRSSSLASISTSRFMFACHAPVERVVHIGEDKLLVFESKSGRVHRVELPVGVVADQPASISDVSNSISGLGGSPFSVASSIPDARPFVVVVTEWVSLTRDLDQRAGLTCFDANTFELKWTKLSMTNKGPIKGPVVLNKNHDVCFIFSGTEFFVTPVDPENDKSPFRVDSSSIPIETLWFQKPDNTGLFKQCFGVVPRMCVSACLSMDDTRLVALFSCVEASDKLLLLGWDLSRREVEWTPVFSYLIDDCKSDVVDAVKGVRFFGSTKRVVLFSDRTAVTCPRGCPLCKPKNPNPSQRERTRSSTKRKNPCD